MALNESISEPLVLTLLAIVCSAAWLMLLAPCFPQDHVVNIQQRGFWTLGEPRTIFLWQQVV